ncbi:hypothetical protein EVAR_9112_1 [Eumeta japonica]|uniref:Uncharacterized protein n=1 Tax=Eumeta variegata TaxID=151549 RepID=A0A4C1TW71_EUMVA|nr:hypothetical protein EVAR_9112_1 [Eumeta japonica]
MSTPTLKRAHKHRPQRCRALAMHSLAAATLRYKIESGVNGHLSCSTFGRVYRSMIENRPQSRGKVKGARQGSRGQYGGAYSSHQLTV